MGPDIERCKNPLWVPDECTIQQSNLSAFQEKIKTDLGLEFDRYQTLHKWSVTHLEQFWTQVWEFGEVRCSKKWDTVLQNPDQFPGAKWFSGARLNFAENLLRDRSDRIAIVSRLENGSRRTVSYSELYKKVAACAEGLRNLGVTRGDRIAGFMPNIPETIVAMLATSSIGAVWSSCSPDFGINGVMDRFGQITPKVLFACDGYFYNGKTLNSLPKLKEICGRIESIEKLVLVPVTNQNILMTEIPNTTLFEDFSANHFESELCFEQLPFDHPLYIMYSSGTTGVPKCIVHSAGGSLIQHLKEHQLHTNLKPEDVLFFFTTCGWMMWNWLVTGLASKATLVLYDGSPFYPQPESLMDIAEREAISIFGVSAKYIAALKKSGARFTQTHDLRGLHTILSTGSPLSDDSFRYVYDEIKSDVALASISGGTDILSAFVLGHPHLPVWEGEIQCKALGMAVEIWNENGTSVTKQKGELVCTKPFPSAPIYFWNDDTNEKYLSAYFDTFPGIWAQGDYAEITEHEGLVIYGRSDAVLNPGGVRIGTAEIYRQVEKLDEVMESICVGQDWEGDVRVILFVVLQPKCRLSKELKANIIDTIRRETTPRHVPAKIIAVQDIPRTISGKIVELAVRKIIHNQSVNNTDALANPEALQLFKNLVELES